MMDRSAARHTRTHTVLTSALAIVLASAFLLPPTVASAYGSRTSKSTKVILAVTGSGTTSGLEVVSFDGALAITNVASQNGRLAVVGTLTGTLTNEISGISQTITNLPVVLAFLHATGNCDGLHFGIGPLDLTALGTAIHLDEITLDITAPPGAPAVLRNLLCTIGALLDTYFSSNVLATLLNQLLPLLR